MASNYISLFTGVGGLDLGLRIALPGAHCVCYVESGIQNAHLLEARIADTSLDRAPLWSDVRTFDGRVWRGRVQGIVGGFPCQDLSVAGKREGIEGSRSGLWAQFHRIIHEVRPDWVFVENVAGLLVNRAMGRVLGDLAAERFDAEWGVFSASECGAPHRRERVFVLAYRPEMADSGYFGSRWDGDALGQQPGIGGGRHSVSLHHVVAAWPTPRGEDAECCGNHPDANDSLTGAAKLWKTPHGMANTDADGKAGGAGGGEFAKQATQWPTPQVQDVRHSGDNADNRLVRGGATPSRTLSGTLEQED